MYGRNRKITTHKYYFAFKTNQVGPSNILTAAWPDLLPSLCGLQQGKGRFDLLTTQEVPFEMTWNWCNHILFGPKSQLEV